MTRSTYDAVIIGARAAGAATALCLARSGARVLVVERDAAVGDTLSTHALMRPAVTLLNHWGLLDGLLARGSQVVTRTTFHYGNETVSIPIAPAPGIPGLVAPRRWHLDRTLIAAACDAGAELRPVTAFQDCLRDGRGRVTGAILRDRAGQHTAVHGAILIGADGRRSAVADAVGAPEIWRSANRTATIYGYVAGVPNEGYRWYFDEEAAAGVIPTCGDQSVVFAFCPPPTFRERFGRNPRQALAGVLGRWCPEAAEAISGDACLRLRRFGGAQGFMRQCSGPGWALVGDAGYFKDPCTAHGLTDALRDAHLLSETLARHGPDGLNDYPVIQQELSHDLFAVTDAIAGFDWDIDRLKSLHVDLAEAQKTENAYIRRGTARLAA